MEVAEFDKLRSEASPVIKAGVDFVIELLHAVECGKAQDEKKD